MRVFSSMTIWLPCERGVLKQFQKYILQKTLIPFHRPILVVAIWQQIAKKKTLICTLGKAIM
jgi:hypothetical protein